MHFDLPHEKRKYRFQSKLTTMKSDTVRCSLNFAGCVGVPFMPLESAAVFLSNSRRPQPIYQKLMFVVCKLLCTIMARSHRYLFQECVLIRANRITSGWNTDRAQCAKSENGWMPSTTAGWARLLFGNVVRSPAPQRVCVFFSVLIYYVFDVSFVSGCSTCLMIMNDYRKKVGLCSAFPPSHTRPTIAITATPRTHKPKHCHFSHDNDGERMRTGAWKLFAARCGGTIHMPRSTRIEI